ncbi:MAG: rhomboid family intramembrane serine protease [Propioniciclava sp.]
MIEASVGHHCPECVARGRAATGQGTLRHGGYPSKNPQLTSLIIMALNAMIWLLVSATDGHYGVLANAFALSPLGVCLLPDGPYGGFAAASCTGSGGFWIPGVAEGALWQPLTSIITHYDLTHLAFNSVSLWFLGPTIERAFGRARFLVVYLLSGLAGAALVLWFGGFTQTIGASGAIFGLLGAILVLVIRQRSNPTMVLMWLGINVTITILNYQSISWQGHLGGFLGGAAVAWALVTIRGRNRQQRQAIALAALGAIVVGCILAFTLLR